MLYIPTSDGIMLAVQDLNQRGSKTVLLVHGWPLSQRMWDYTIPALLEQDCRVVTYDLAGFGDSDTPASGYNYDLMAADLFDLIRYLHLEHITLVCFSMGGAISVRYIPVKISVTIGGVTKTAISRWWNRCWMCLKLWR